MHWQTTRFRIDLARPQVMGIVNVTPDSFSDAGRHGDSAAAIAHCETLLREGADILDIGGESTRPGARAPTVEEELQRVLPVLRHAVTLGVPISVDSSRAPVVRAALDVEAMDCAARQLLGQHDFSAFRAAGCQARTPVRDIRLFRVRRSGGLVLVDVVANAFLQHMVRNLVGSLLLIGDGRRDAAWLRAVLERRDRRLAGPTAAATGLYLTAVDYVRDYGFDSGHRLPWFINQGAGGP